MVNKLKYIFIASLLCISSLAWAGSTHTFGTTPQPNTSCQITSYESGDDGSLKRGFSPNPRFVNLGNNTVLDRATNLQWIREPQKIIQGGDGTTVPVAHNGWTNGHAYVNGDVITLTLATDASSIYSAFVDDTSYTTGQTIYHDDTGVNKRFVAKSNFVASDREPTVGVGWGSFWSQAAQPDAWQAYTSYNSPTSKVYAGSGDTYYQCAIANTADDFQPASSPNYATKWSEASYSEWGMVENTTINADTWVYYYSGGYKYYKCLLTHYAGTHEPTVDPNYASVWTELTVNPWAAQTSYDTNSWTTNGGLLYDCLVAHYSGDNEPGTDPNWDNVWDQLTEAAWQEYYNYADTDYVSAGAVLYDCTVAHYAGDYEPGVDGSWWDKWNDTMAGAWAIDYTYMEGEHVSHSGTYYRSTANDNLANTPPTAQWATVTSTAWAGDTPYSATTSYVTSGGSLYRCYSSHISTNYQPGVSFDWSTKWQTATTAAWATDTSYTTGSGIIANDSEWYNCSVNHFSGTREPGTGSGFETYWATRTTTNWAGDTSYTTDSYVLYNSTTYYDCTSAHYSGDREPTTGTGWETYWEEQSTPADWVSGTSYTATDKVHGLYGFGTIYTCTSSHVASQHQPNVDADWDTYWDAKTASDWAVDQDYATSGPSVTKRGDGYFYTCTSSHRSSNHEPIARDDYATYWTLQESKWDGSDWSAASVSYEVGDIVRDDGSSQKFYKCTVAHTSGSDEFQPTQGAKWPKKWQLLNPIMVCTSNHTATSATEPYQGDTYDTYWDIQDWSGSAANVTTPGGQNWYQGMQNSEALTYAGYSDWHIPNVNELMTLIDYSKGYGVAGLDSVMFPNPGSSYYYVTSTTSLGSGATEYRKFVDFTTKTMLDDSIGVPSGGTFYVRPCRKVK